MITKFEDTLKHKLDDIILELKTTVALSTHETTYHLMLIKQNTINKYYT